MASGGGGGYGEKYESTSGEMSRALQPSLGNSGSPEPTEEDSCEDERMRLAIYDRVSLEAAKAIKASDHWADNHWPSPVERLWYVAAQEEIAELRAALRARETPPERTLSAAERRLITAAEEVSGEEYRLGPALRGPDAGASGPTDEQVIVALMCGLTDAGWDCNDVLSITYKEMEKVGAKTASRLRAALSRPSTGKPPAKPGDPIADRDYWYAEAMRYSAEAIALQSRLNALESD